MYLKFQKFASSIVLAACFFLTVGCDTLGLPDLTRHDEVPDEVKAMPRQVTIPAETEYEDWPRLGDIPSKPKNFPPKAEYNHYMDELQHHRAEADALKKEVIGQSLEPQLPSD